MSKSWRGRSPSGNNVEKRILPMRSMGFGAITLAALAFAAPSALASEGVKHEERPLHYNWSFSGFFGRYDQAQLRRGFKIYRDVCSSCHSIKLLAFRNLGEPGGPAFSQEEVAQIAASYKIKDGPTATGDFVDRPGRASDRFPPPFANEQAARAALGGGYPPDMSVLAKARGYSRGFPTFLLDGLPGLVYQEAGRRLGMIQPLLDGSVAYDDKTPQTVDQYAQDISAFLMWSAEPHLDQRKSIGRGVVGFLIVFAGLLYFVKRRIWASVRH